MAQCSTRNLNFIINIMYIFLSVKMTILLRMDDKMNRQLTCLVSEIDTALLLAEELVHFGFINEVRISSFSFLLKLLLRFCMFLRVSYHVNQHNFM